MTVFIISTMTDSVGYTFFKHVGDLPVPRKKITIRGGAAIPSLKSGFGERTSDGEGKPMWTAEGMCTPVKDEDYQELKDHWLFKKHIDSGHLKVVTRDIRDDHKAVVKEVRTMETSWQADPSRQLTPQNIKERVGNKHLKIHEMEADTDFRL